MAKDWSNQMRMTWNLLVAAAKQQRCLTYSEVASEVGTGGPRKVGDLLYPIQDHCQRNRLPPLTGLVVRKSDGKPGDGFEGVPEDMREVCDFDWEQVPNPFNGE